MVKAIFLNAYTINDYTYFKLRDIAYVMKASSAPFFCKLERTNSQYSNLFKCEGYRNIRTYQGLLFR